MRVMLVVLALLSATIACAQKTPLPDCEWCGTSEAPARLTSTVRIAGSNEPGERMVISGNVYETDGRTPASNVVVYAYHTNAQGIYPKRGNETGNARRHGYLRGWLRTDAQGRYRIESIRPGGYPGRPDPAHIHLVVKVEGKAERWIDELVFDDDPRVAAYRNRPGFAIVKLTKQNGTWMGTRNIVLPE
jgi:protocatechuate 3,4-dioxygenase beta subunit